MFLRRSLGTTSTTSNSGRRKAAVAGLGIAVEITKQDLELLEMQ